ncbi:PLC-like phosphodiesterase [Bimuria novae-zelandiae CBS 107.79]|uniref:PLC-like phosphodiesterase n=1 Tax=Bimuria novae-zelandiae CBS 107.79 TaxID=1447943 RepID=A0A6A5VBN4_9PLEO|nr:PLC-like phosphodiesterase [Bimuria novae-zelandiae CBS 107.79]
MGYGGFLTLLNGTPRDWVVSSQPSYQMDKWEWPTIKAGTSAQVYVEWGQKGRQKDDAGEAYYSIADTPDTFQVLARKPDDFHITINLDGMATKQSPKGSQIDLGFRHDRSIHHIVSTDELGDWWSNAGDLTDWMQQSLGSLGNRTLKQICMPGSHDAGMSEFDPGTIGAHFSNSQTQYLNFYDQLVAGSRYFDLRPVISGGEWKAGHYSAIEDIWVGGNGMKLSDIINQVNDFTSKYKELVIINLSHTLDTDNDYKDLSQDQWNDLFEQLTAVNNRFTADNPGTHDFSGNTLGSFITDHASVFIFAQLPNGISLGDYANKGFFSAANFPIYDSYSNSNSAGDMQKDQLGKLAAERNLVADDAARKDVFHILSWTLTQQPEDVLNPDNAIMNLASEVYDALFVDAFNAFTPEAFPNVLYVDAIGVRDKPVRFPFDEVKEVGRNYDIISLAVAVNNAKAGKNVYITG